jgi:hypothetical protein
MNTLLDRLSTCHRRLDEASREMLATIRETRAHLKRVDREIAAMNGKAARLARSS